MYLVRDGWRTDGELALNPYDRSENDCCAKCAADVAAEPDAIVIASYIHYEGAPKYCEYCNGFTDSAYGDPSEDEDEDTELPALINGFPE
jgi:hypothetical protein